MDITLLDILILLSLSQGFIFGFAILFSDFFKKSPNKFLAFSIIMISIMGVNELLEKWNLDDDYYFIDFLGDDAPWVLLFYVPMFVFFLKSVKHPISNSPKLYLLTIPFLLFLVLNIIIDLDVDFGIYEIPEIEQVMRITYTLEYNLGMIYAISLNVLSFFVIANSTQSAIDQKWLKRIWGFLTLIIGLWILQVLMPEEEEFVVNLMIRSVWLGISVFIYWITYKGVYQLKLSQDQQGLQKLLSDQDASISENEIRAKKEEPKQEDPIQKINPYLHELEQILLSEHLYRDPAISRDQLAERLGISSGYLSQLFQNSEEKNFTSYINRFRVEEVKRMIIDPASDRFSLLAIGREAGFQSKSAFYTTFKRETGMTPSEFKKQHRSS